VAAIGGATIVIVEPSAAVQELVEQALRETGDRVLVTQNPLEVLEVVRRVRVDLLVTDIDSRPGLVEQVRTTQPEVRVLYLSRPGDDEPAGPRRTLSLPTPFSLDELRAAIAAQLDRAEPGVSAAGETES
jgi:DNA-binding response OmpR family regulator